MLNYTRDESPEEEKGSNICPECGANTQKEFGTVAVRGNSKIVTNYSTCTTCGRVIETISNYTNVTGSDLAPEWKLSKDYDPLAGLTKK